MKKAKKVITSILLVSLLVLGTLGVLFVGYKVVNKFLWQAERYFISPKSTTQVFDYSWAQQSPGLIAHAFGGIDGIDYTNSREAFLHNYELGHRIFEVDFYPTDPENILVAAHDLPVWDYLIRMNATSEVDSSFTYSNFMETKLCGVYTPLDYQDVIDLMIEYPDIYIVPDIKLIDEDSVHLQFSQLVDYAMETDSSVLDRIIPQIYTVPMLEWVLDVYPFESMIFSLYRTDWTPKSIEYFCEKTSVGFIALPEYAISQSFVDFLKERDIIVGVLTYNEEHEAEAFYDMGVDFIYTDFLTPAYVDTYIQKHPDRLPD